MVSNSKQAQNAIKKKRNKRGTIIESGGKPVQGRNTNFDPTGKPSNADRLELAQARGRNAGLTPEQSPILDRRGNITSQEQIAQEITDKQTAQALALIQQQTHHQAPGELPPKTLPGVSAKALVDDAGRPIQDFQDTGAIQEAQRLQTIIGGGLAAATAPIGQTLSTTEKGVAAVEPQISKATRTTILKDSIQSVRRSKIIKQGTGAVQKVKGILNTLGALGGTLFVASKAGDFLGNLGFSAFKSQIPELQQSINTLGEEASSYASEVSSGDLDPETGLALLDQQEQVIADLEREIETQKIANVKSRIDGEMFDVVTDIKEKKTEIALARGQMRAKQIQQQFPEADEDVIRRQISKLTNEDIDKVNKEYTKRLERIKGTNFSDLFQESEKGLGLSVPSPEGTLAQ